MSQTQAFVPVPPPAGIPFPEYYSTFVDWRFPIISAIVYTVTIAVLNPKTGKVSRVVAASKGISQKSSKSGTAMTTFVFLHNLALCLFSLGTFIGMVSAMLRNFFTHSFTDAYCDRDQSLWNNALGYYGYLFYLSKYYEIVDTIIILAKGRRSSLLQTYHHAGAIITMWSGVSYGATAIWIFVVFNSFIHTIMYAYYAATSVGLNPPGKKYLTTMQITQFIVGTTLAVSYLFVDGCHQTPGSRLATLINVSYLLPLTGLFVDFAKRTYSNRKINGKAPVANGKTNGHLNGYYAKAD